MCLVPKEIRSFIEYKKNTKTTNHVYGFLCTECILIQSILVNQFYTENSSSRWGLIIFQTLEPKQFRVPNLDIFSHLNLEKIMLTFNRYNVLLGHALIARLLGLSYILRPKKSLKRTNRTKGTDITLHKVGFRFKNKCFKR